MWKNEQEYLDAWVWSSWYGGWYCRTNHEVYATMEEAVEVVRARDRAAGIVWPWQVKERV